MNDKNTENFNFQQALDELNSIVVKMEQGNLPLEEALQYFEKGISLTRQCQKALQEAEQKVQILLEKNGEITLNPYYPEE
jgi:exodeoxyribonuclease VII small subunit